MSNKSSKSKKVEDISVGVPDGAISPEEDTDPYVTKIGGIPIWLNNDKPPTANVCKCKVCGDWMYLLCQCYAPLSDSIYHRVIYIWACNRRQCMRKDGSFSVLRSHLVDKEYLKAQQQKEEQKKKKAQKKPSGFGAPQGFQLGDVWGASKSFGTSNTNSFGTKPFGVTNTNTFGAKPFGSSNTATFFGDSESKDNKNTTTSLDTKNSRIHQETLAEHLSKLNLKEEYITEPSTKVSSKELQPLVDIEDLPSFPGEYIYITPETNSEEFNMGIDMSKYQEYIDMENELLQNGGLYEDGNEHGDGTWANEQYEKQQLPRGVDKQFKKFTERVTLEPNQCLRYEWDGSPLLYHEISGNKHQEKCYQCGQPKIFEMQLMPNILSLLPTSEIALKNQQHQQQQQQSSSSSSSSHHGKAKLDTFNVGMEFGTILIYVCKNDCHPGDVHDTSYVLETAVVQYELD